MGAVKPMVRLPSTNSRIWSNVSRSMFCMVMFIHPKHGTFLRLSLRLISHWKHFAPPGSSRIGNEPPLQAHSALDNSIHCLHRDSLVTFASVPQTLEVTA